MTPVEIEMAVLKTKLDSMHITQKQTLEQVKYTNGRVQALERWKNFVLGFCGAVSVMITYLVKMFL